MEQSLQGKVYTMVSGIEGMEPISGTWEEIRRVLDGYPMKVLREVFQAEMYAGRTALYRVMLSYYCDREVEELGG